MTDARLSRLFARVLIGGFPIPPVRISREHVSVAYIKPVTPEIRLSRHTIQVIWSPNNLGGGPATGPAIRWWDGTAEQVATLEGWWDGSTVQPASAEGWWDGSITQPLA